MLSIHVCAIAKNEDRYIEDWLKYHFKLGFTHICIYDNNIPERKGDLRKLIDNSKKLSKGMKQNTEIIDANGLMGFQNKAYNNYYHTHEFDWCAFIDIDEFIHLEAWDNMSEMLTDDRFTHMSVIFLTWNTISDDDIVDVPDDFIFRGKRCKDITDIIEREEAACEWEKIPVYERFHETTTTYEPFNHKQIVRGGIKNIQILF